MRKKHRFVAFVGTSLVIAVLATLPAVVSASPAGDAAVGKELFDKNCASCHGEAGVGGLGPPLAKDVGYFVQADTPVQVMGPLLEQSVRSRPPGSAMPSFSPDQLSSAELADIGEYLYGLTPAPASPIGPGSADAGAPLYVDNCSTCHGARGEGGKGPPLALMAAELQKTGAPPNVLLGLSLLATRSGAMQGMPTFAEEELTDAQLADIAAHLWAIGPETAASMAETLPQSGQSSFPLLPVGLAAGLSLLFAGMLMRMKARRSPRG